MARKPFNFGDAPLVQETERTIENGYDAIERKEQGRGTAEQPVGSVAVPQQPKQPTDESTKGVQAYIPMSQYRRLNDIKLTRRENIAALVAQAISFWLDAQDGK